MPTFSKKKKTALIASVLVLASGAAAFGYWTTTGSGSGSAETGTSAAVTIVQSGSSETLRPGGPASTLSGTFTNPNDGPVYVNQVTATLASVTGSSGTPACTVADYALVTDTITVAAEVAADDSTTWSGIQVRMVNSAANQDACKNATINLAYTSN